MLAEVMEDGERRKQEREARNAVLVEVDKRLAIARQALDREANHSVASSLYAMVLLMRMHEREAD